MSHRSTEAEIISLDAAVRMDGIPALDLWDLVIEVLHSDSNQKQKLKPKRGRMSASKTKKKTVQHTVFPMTS